MASKNALLAGRRLGRDLALVHRLVGQHRLADHVADGEDVRDVGAHLLVDRDEAALVDRDAGVLRPDQLAVRPAADRDEHPVEAYRSPGPLPPSNVTCRPSGLGLDRRDLGLEAGCSRSAWRSASSAA